MIASVGNIANQTSGLASGNGAATAGSTPNADFQNFLKLLTTQLRNQDPLSPLDSTQFVAQLASFSTVEQLVSANSRLDAIATQLGGDGGIDKYAAWIGREAEVANIPTTYLGAETPFRIAYDPNASRVDLVARDAAGREVGRYLAANSNAAQLWAPIGLDQGQYQLSAEYFDADSVIATRSATTFSTIMEVRQNNGSIILGLANGAEVAPGDVFGLSAFQ